MANDAQAFRLAEYRHISTAIIDLDRRILTVLFGAVAAAGSLLAVALPGVLNATTDHALAWAYFALSPTLLVGAALAVQLAQRRDMMRLGAYRRVFFEEDEPTGLRWESALEPFRTLHPKETNDPIPWVYWVVVLIGVSLFVVGLLRDGGPLCQAAIAIAPIALLAGVHRAWTKVVTADLGQFTAAWRHAKTTLAKPKAT